MDNDKVKLAMDKTEPTLRNSRRRWINSLIGMIGPLLFIWLLTRIDLKQIWVEISKVNLFWLSVFMVTIVPIIMARAWRLRIIMKAFALSLTYGQTVLIRWVGTAAGDLLPGRMGELVSIAYLQKIGYGVGDPTLALLLDRLFDLFWMAVWSIGAIIFIGSTMRQRFDSLVWILGLFLLSMVIGIVGLIVLRQRSKGGYNFLNKMVPARWQSKVISILKGSQEHKFTYTTSQLILVMSVSLIALIFSILRAYLLALALNLNISLIFLAAILGFASLLQLLPISYAFGIGTRDVTLVYLFGLVGISAERALSFSMIILASLVFQDLVGLFLWWRYPVGTPFMNSPTYPAEDTHSV